MSDKERQFDELVLLQSMYPEEFTWQTPPGPDADISELQDADFRFSIQIASYTLDVTLPTTYPSTTKPTAYLQCAATTPTSTRKSARAILSDILAALDPGTEILDILVQDLSSRLESLSASAAPTDHPCSTQDDATKKPQKIKRLLIWSHHLLATSKRKDIIAWSRELHLSGFSRPGYPGAIVVEGDKDNVDEFETRIKALRWQALQVRGEEVGEGRVLVRDGKAVGFREVEGLDDVVRGLKECEDRLGEWFLEGMRIGHG
ncbi:hypothetical protein B9Z65_7405 [Elsinoe australis]|uniref:RWD domain-containing protein n=1 Tax=Elsinoe australis TaxID=40998 RepID=A0A2P7YC17_9PEZI|nr:hypothetical protein B9Z65_7405 [Elsinoe australis]